MCRRGLAWVRVSRVSSVSHPVSVTGGWMRFAVIPSRPSSSAADFT